MWEKTGMAHGGHLSLIHSANIVKLVGGCRSRNPASKKLQQVWVWGCGGDE
jgi:hypothetical protein